MRDDRLFPRLMTCVAAAALLATSGCGRAPLDEALVGRWVGRPDTAAERQERTPSKLSTLAPGADKNALGPTDLEAFDFEVTLELAPRGQLQMWLGSAQGGGGRDKLTGVWQIVQQTGEFALLELTNSASKSATGESKPEQRRFEIRLTPDGSGFTLREEGADPMFGWMYFQRAS